MNAKQIEKLARIRKLLYEATQHAIKEFGGGKINECYTEVCYGPYSDSVEPSCLMIYSYMLGPSRRHYFAKGHGEGDHATWYCGDRDIFDVALEIVGGWHEEEMNLDNQEGT